MRSDLFASASVSPRFCFLLAGLTVALPAPGFGQSAASSPRASLIAADRAVSAAVLQQGLAAGLGSVLADGAVLLYEGAPVTAGTEAIQRLLLAQPVLRGLKLQWLPIVIALSSDGLMGMTSGPTVIARRGQSIDSVLQYGHYISVWRRRAADAPWRIAALLENGLADPDSVVLGFPTGSDQLSVMGGRPFADADIAFAKLAADSGAPIAFGTFAALDATTPPGTGMVTVGAPAIRARMQAIGAGNSVWKWHPVHAGSSASGDLGFTVGESAIAESGEPNAPTSHGKYLTIWRRQPDGSIRYILDSGNPRPAQAR